ncbi:MAG: oligosaccharide flippase family protein [Chitinophagales bacterium]
MNKKTLSNIIFLLGVNVIIKPFWLFGIDRVVQNKLGEEVFGAYFVLFNFSMLYQIILDFGIQQFNSKEIAQNHKNLSHYFINLLASKAFLALLYLALAIPTFILLGYSWTTFGNLILLLLTNQILISLIFYLRSNLAGLHKFKLDAFFSIFDKVVMILLGASLLYFNFLNIELNIFNFALIQTIGFAINAFVLIIVVGKIAIPFQIDINRTLIFSIARKSMPFALSVFLMSIYLRMDAIMIERMLGKQGAYEAGIYAQSFRIIDALNMIGILFANVLLPTYAKRLSDKKFIAKLLAQACALLLIIIIPIATLVFWKSNYIINTLYTNGSPYSACILSVLMVSFLAYNIMHVFSSLLTAAGKLKRLNIIFTAGILFNLVTNFIFIPKLGAKGAAITTSISEILVLFIIAYNAILFLRMGKKRKI